MSLRMRSPLVVATLFLLAFTFLSVATISPVRAAGRPCVNPRTGALIPDGDVISLDDAKKTRIICHDGE
jgi:hypothetical protein